MQDYSERADGPMLFAVGGSDETDSEFRLGTREYDWHQHVRGQFFCVASGLVHVRTVHGSWLLPPHRAGWIPPGMAHKISVSGAMRGWCVALRPDASRHLPGEPCVVAVSELMHALVRRVAGWSEPECLSAEAQRLAAVLLDEMMQARQQPLCLPMPVDHRLVRIAQRLVGTPACRATLEELAQDAGLSARTARRLFLAETGMNFVRWRQQAQLVHALERLACGESVASVADALGYAAPSTFIAMFRRAFGDSPARYFLRRGSAG